MPRPKACACWLRNFISIKISLLRRRKVHVILKFSQGRIPVCLRQIRLAEGGATRNLRVLSQGHSFASCEYRSLHNWVNAHDSSSVSVVVEVATVQFLTLKVVASDPVGTGLLRRLFAKFTVSLELSIDHSWFNLAERCLKLLCKRFDSRASLYLKTTPFKQGCIRVDMLFVILCAVSSLGNIALGASRFLLPG